MTGTTITIQQLISLSHAMLDKAKEDVWEEFSVLEGRRRELINAFFLVPHPPVYLASISDGIQAILAIDNEIMLLAAQKKQLLEQALHHIEQGQRAIKAYSS